jgi:hypothetical protein
VSCSRVFSCTFSAQVPNGWESLREAVKSFLNVRIQAGASDVVSIVLFNTEARRLLPDMRPLLDCA